MTAPAVPNGGSDGDRGRRLRRRIALALILTLIVMTVLFTPELTGGRMGDSRLTTYSTEPQGAALLYNLAGRLGWQVARSTDDTVVADSRTTIALLAPPWPLAATETHHVLEQVRAGSALLYVMGAPSPLSDSLHVKRSFGGGKYLPTRAGTAEAVRDRRGADTLRARRFGIGGNGSNMAVPEDSVVDDEETASAECTGKGSTGGGLPLWTDDAVHLARLSWTRPRPADAVIFARADNEGAPRDSNLAGVAAVGFTLGRGRVVVVSDPDQLRNDVLRVCHWGLDVVAVRMLEYLARGAPTARDRIVFDEYHQGYGVHPGTLRAIVRYLSRTPSGHVLLQCLLAGLVLLLALGPRAVPAHDPERVERRSPLEHVGALARAYARVGATRTVTARLLHGVRRRVERGGPASRPRNTSDVAFLDDARRIAPDRGDDIAIIRRALTTTITPRELESVGGALARLEHSLETQRR